MHERLVSEASLIKRYDEIQDKDRRKLEIHKEGVRNLLRFMQLFAEGHYADLQNYTRHQTNSYHSYDLLADFSDLLNAYMHLKHKDFFENMIQCFDTIIEYIQGPCIENQSAVM